MKRNRKYLILFSVFIVVSCIRFVYLNGNMERKYTIKEYSLKSPIKIDNTNVEVVFNDYKVVDNIKGVENVGNKYKYVIVDAKISNLGEVEEKNIVFHTTLGSWGAFKQGVSPDATIKINGDYKKVLEPKKSTDYKFVFSVDKVMDLNKGKLILTMPKEERDKLKKEELNKENMIRKICVLK